MGSVRSEVIGFFSQLNSSSRTMILGLTHPVTEMNARNLSVGLRSAGA
jgi:hypothetical protein